jgi:hypothetical protein
MPYISMMQAVRQHIEPSLVEQGFVLTDLQQEPFEVLVYKRATDGSRISIHDNGDDAIHIGDTRLFIDVRSRGATLLSLKELLPNYLSIPLLESKWWTYRSEEELSVCIGEIREIVAGALVDWLQNPVSNPTKVPLPNFTSDMMKRMLESRQHSAERARNDGRLEDLARIEQSLEKMKKKLDEMLKAESDSSSDVKTD